MRVEVGNVHAQIVGAGARLLADVEAEFTVEPKGARYMLRSRPGWDGTVRLVRGGRFLAGLLPRVLDALERRGLTEVRLVDLRRKPLRRDVGALAFEPRDYQEAMASALDCGRGVVRSATNSGKTKVAVAMTQRTGARTLFMTPTADLARQTADVYRADLPGARVCLLTGGAPLDAEAWDADVVVANVQALSFRVRKGPPPKRGSDDPGRAPSASRRPKKRWLGKFTDEGGAFLDSFGMAIGDECHLLTSREWEKLFTRCREAYYRFMLSATPETGDPVRDTRLAGVAGEVVAGIGQRELMDRGLSARITVELVAWAPPSPIATADWERQLAYVTDGAERNGAIAGRVREAVDAGQRVLVIVDRYRHAELLGELIGRPWVFLSGATRRTRLDDLAEFRSGRRPVAVATRVLNQGISIDEIDAMAIAAGGGKAALAVQRAGRLARVRPDKAAATLYVPDDGARGLYAPSVPPHRRYLARHFKTTLRALRAEGFEVAGERVPARNLR